MFLKSLAKPFLRSHWVQVKLRKTGAFLGLQRFLAGYTLRPFFPTDIRLFRLLYCLEQTKGFPDPVAEFGIGSGYGMTYMLSTIQGLGDKRSYHGFDTFQGFPYIHPEDLENLPEERKSVSVVGRYAEFGIDHIRGLARAVGMGGRVTFHKGPFEDTLPLLASDQRFSFVFLDCDLYQSYLTSLDHLYHRVVPGGIFLFDEYEHTVDWPGARKAIDEFFADKPEKPEPLPFGDSWMVVKGKVPPQPKAG